MTLSFFIILPVFLVLLLALVIGGILHSAGESHKLALDGSTPSPATKFPSSGGMTAKGDEPGARPPMKGCC